MSLKNISLIKTNESASGDRRAYVSGLDVYENPVTKKWYTLIPICKGRFQSGYSANNLCLNPYRGEGYCCSAHTRQSEQFIPLESSDESSENEIQQ